MNLLTELFGAEMAASSVFIYLLQVTGVVGVGLVAARLFLWHAALRHHILIFTWLAVLGLPFMTVIVQVSGTAELLRSQGLAHILPSVLFEKSGPPSQLDGGLDDVALVPSGEPSVAAAAVRPWILGLSLVWLGGLAVHLIRLADSFRRLGLLLRRSSRPRAGGRLETLCAAVARDLVVSGTPRIRISNRCDGPAVVGVFRPTLIFPADLEHRLTAPQLRHVVIHEMAHVARRDYATSLIQHLLGAVFWFHPLIHVLNRQLSWVREELCDNYVLCRADKAAYGYTLLEIAKGTGRYPTIFVSIALFSQSWSLEKRISQFLDRKRNTMTRIGMMRTGSVALGVWLVTCSIALLYPSPALSESDPGTVASSEPATADDPGNDSAGRVAESQALLVELSKIYEQLEYQRRKIEEDMIVIEGRLEKAKGNLKQAALEAGILEKKE